MCDVAKLKIRRAHPREKEEEKKKKNKEQQ